MSPPHFDCGLHHQIETGYSAAAAIANGASSAVTHLYCSIKTEVAPSGHCYSQCFQSGQWLCAAYSSASPISLTSESDESSVAKILSPRFFDRLRQCVVASIVDKSSTAGRMDQTSTVAVLPVDY